MQPSGSNTTSLQEKWAIGVGVASLIAFVILFVVMVRTTGTTDNVRWTRLTYLFGSAEAIVFAFVGWIFGREVHRKRAEAAEDKVATEATRSEAANEALRDEVVARTDAEARGKALADAVRAHAYVDTEPELLAGHSAPVRHALVALAESLFPPSR